MLACTFCTSGTTLITNGLAIVMVGVLECGVTYTIIAGGSLNGSLVGPSRPYGKFPTCACPINMMGEFSKCI